MKAEREEDKPVQPAPASTSQHQPATTVNVAHQFPLPEMTNINLFGISVYWYMVLAYTKYARICIFTDVMSF